MNVWAVVPVKPLNRSKSRLSSVLTPDQREALSRQMLERTMNTLKQVKDLAGILVVSRDMAALRLARKYEAQTIQESGAPELNDALTRATQVLTTFNARGVMVVASDIPLMRTEHLEGMLSLAKFPPTLVIAADRHQDGTNIMLMRPPGLIPYCYGKGSFEKHVEAAKAIDAGLHVYESPHLALDVDTPADLDLYREMLLQQETGEPAWLESV